MIKTLLCFLLFITLSTKAQALEFDSYVKGNFTRADAKDYVSESEFNEVIHILYNLYKKDIENKGQKNFLVYGDWNDDTVNAYALRDDNSWSVHVSGGIARSEGMNKDSLALIVCHEIGHHLAGAPLTYRFNGWPSAEGQADYWATSKCLKRYYYHLINENFFIDSELPEKAIRDCGVVYNNAIDYRICLRTMNAVQAFARFLNNLSNNRQSVSILTPENKQVKGTNLNDYPRPQCRLDTVYSGALCYLDSSYSTSDSDARVGHCNDANKPGVRPRCWFKPKN